MVGLLRGTPSSREAVATYRFTQTSWGEGQTLPMDSEASRRACAICRFAECKSIRKPTVSLTPPSAENPWSFQESKMKQPEQGMMWWLLLVYSDSQCVGCSVWGIWLTSLFMTLGPGFTSVPKLATSFVHPQSSKTLPIWNIQSVVNTWRKGRLKDCGLL